MVYPVPKQRVNKPLDRTASTRSDQGKRSLNQDMNKTIGYSIAFSGLGAAISLVVIAIGNGLSGNADMTDIFHGIASVLVIGVITLAVAFARGKKWAQLPLQISLILIAGGFVILMGSVVLDEKDKGAPDCVNDAGMILMLVAPILGASFCVRNATLPE
jgi:hypothetical protein